MTAVEACDDGSGSAPEAHAAAYEAALAAHRRGDAALARAAAVDLCAACETHARGWALRAALEPTEADDAAAARRALDFAERAWRLRPDSRICVHSLVRALVRLDAAAKPRTSLDVLRRAADLAPDDATMQFGYGSAARSLKLPDVAAEAYRRTLAIDPLHERAAFWLATLGGAIDAVKSAPLDHVRALYDGYAPRYDSHLAEALKSRTPDLCAAALFAAAGGPIGACIDLGCGTGLSGAALRSCGEFTRLDGVDLSSAMAALSRSRGCYDDVACADLCAALLEPNRFAIYAAAVVSDVLVYFGDLDPFFAACAHAAKPAAWLVFSLEDAAEGATWELATTGRFKHGVAHVIATANARGFAVETATREALRMQAGLPVAGTIYVCRAPATPSVDARP
ncbi:S-adenosyl-L-methionine-dependent methyltransferase [Pelagophyceae sp. CCMP2097]|nr:S-adenosyl-L-methionine-dependent methyltransferase [Pelagophyceae sp. CCMP2097]